MSYLSQKSKRQRFCKIIGYFVYWSQLCCEYKQEVEAIAAFLAGVLALAFGIKLACKNRSIKMATKRKREEDDIEFSSASKLSKSAAEEGEK